MDNDFPILEKAIRALDSDLALKLTVEQCLSDYIQGLGTAGKNRTHANAVREVYRKIIGTPYEDTHQNH